MYHYAKCLVAGFHLDLNDFTLEEQEAISSAVISIKQDKENDSVKGWSTFFNRCVTSINKTIAAAHKQRIK